MISEIIKSQNLQADKAEVAERMNQIAGGYSDSEQVLQAYTSNPGMMSQIEMLVLEQHAVNWVLGQVKQIDDKKSFSEIMNFTA